MNGSAARQKVITLDLDDTLWDAAPTLARAERRVHDWLGANYPELARRCSIETMREHRRRLAEAEPQLRHDLSALRRISLARLARAHGHPETLADEALAVFLEVRSEVSCYPEVLPVLQHLQRRFRLVALSNGNADVRRTAVGALFDHALSPATVGTSKPDPAMFRAVMAATGAAAADITHVGDEPGTDILGAQRAGVRSVWVNRGGGAWPDTVSRPDAEIATLAELPGLLGRWWGGEGAGVTPAYAHGAG